MSLRGLVKARCEWLLVCATHNLRALSVGRTLSPQTSTDAQRAEHPGMIGVPVAVLHLPARHE